MKKLLLQGIKVSISNHKLVLLEILKILGRELEFQEKIQGILYSVYLSV